MLFVATSWHGWTLFGIIVVSMVCTPGSKNGKLDIFENRSEVVGEFF